LFVIIHLKICTHSEIAQNQMPFPARQTSGFVFRIVANGCRKDMDDAN